MVFWPSGGEEKYKMDTSKIFIILTTFGTEVKCFMTDPEVGRIALKTGEDLHKADVNMQTIIFIGNSTSFTYLDFMVTPRGYSEKYL